MKLDITDMAQKTGELSGGQRKRLALATVVLKPCDVLILDEPTNHLDYEMVEWLEDYLRRFRGAIIMITHDRYFLDSVCNRIVEVDKGQTYSYDTNYSGFLELKAAREESERASERKRQSILRKEIEWMQRGARARSTKQKAHIQRYEALRDQKGPQTDGKVELSSVSSRMGRTTIELHDISKAYGDIVCVKNFTYIFLKNDRIGIIGENGCGKSTLMSIRCGIEQIEEGTCKVNGLELKKLTDRASSSKLAKELFWPAVATRPVPSSPRSTSAPAWTSPSPARPSTAAMACSWPRPPARGSITWTASNGRATALASSPTAR